MRFPIPPSLFAFLVFSVVNYSPWPLFAAEAEIETNTVAEAYGLHLDGAPMLHFAKRLDVVAWWLE